MWILFTHNNICKRTMTSMNQIDFTIEKEYIAPNLEITHFELKSVITLSDGTGGGGWEEDDAVFYKYWE